MSMVHLALSRYKTSQELRESIERQTGELVNSELNRCDDEWHAAVASVKDTVAVLERTCDAFLSKTHMAPSGAVAHLVDRLVKTAADEAERATERVRSEAGLQLASVQALANRLEGELTVARGDLITTREQFEAEHTARTRAEAEWQDAHTHYDQMALARESELQRQKADLETRRQECETLSQQLESARVEREALTAVLHTVQSAIQQAIVAAVVPANSARGRWAANDGAQTAAHSTGVAADRTSANGGAPAVPLTTRTDAADRRIEPRASEAAAESDPTIGPYVESLLGAAEQKHREDLESGLLPAEVADRLTSNLREARNQFVQNVGALYTEAAWLFESQLMRLIDRHGATTFGRHLGIAAYELDAAKAS